MTKWNSDYLSKFLNEVKVYGKKDRIKDLDDLLEEMMNGKITRTDDLYTSIHIFGEAKYYKARKVVEKYLTHKNSSLRYIALSVLITHWKIKSHTNTLLEFLEKEKDGENRLLVVSSLGYLHEGTDAPDECPACAHPRDHFELLGENY